MNTRYRIFIGVGALVFVLLGLFPPWAEVVDVPYKMHFEKFAGYSFIGSPPKSISGYRNASLIIAVNQLCIEWAIVTAVVVGLVVIFQPKTSKNSKTTERGVVQSDRDQQEGFKSQPQTLDAPPIRMVLAWRARSDDPADRAPHDPILELFQIAIKKWAPHSTVLTFREGSSAWAELSRTDPDLLVMRWGSDYSSQILESLRERTVKYPIVIVKTYIPAKTAELIRALAPNLNIIMLPMTENMMEVFQTVFSAAQDARQENTESGMRALNGLRLDLGDCQRCKLASSRTNIVFGSGNPNAELVFVGEAPGIEEDQQGLPFVGVAGQLLTKIIGSTGMKPEDVYLCNVLKCRPPENRNPEPDEVHACRSFLKRQLATIRPKVVCCLGRVAAQHLLQSAASVSELRGQFHDVDGMRVIATFHPAYLLRSPEKKPLVWEDMKQIRDELFRLRG